MNHARKKQKSPKKGIVVKPVLHNEMSSRCQVDLIDMQSNPDRDMKFILVYPDHLTKFVLRSLHSKRADEVACHLVDIFTTFGAPNILHSLISDFRRVLNIVCILLGISPASDCSLPTFRNPLSVPSSRAGCRV